MEKIYSNCGGGLANRLGCFITAYYFATITNKHLDVNWPIDCTSCLAAWGDLFKEVEGVSFKHAQRQDLCTDVNYQYSSASLLDDLSDVSGVIFLAHNITVGPGEDVRRHRQMTKQQIVDVIMNEGVDKKIVITDNGISNHVPHDFVMNVYKNIIVPVDSILNKVDTFCNENDISRDTTLGCQMRLTDAPSSGDKIEIYSAAIKQTVGNTNKQIFVCSDESEAEDQIYNRFPSKVLLNKKTEYVEKYDKDRAWRDGAENYVDYPCGFNVTRSRQSVVDAVTDLWILSRTEFKSTPFPINGSFAKIAQLVGQSNEKFN